MKKHDGKSSAARKAATQFAALCYRQTKKKGVEILLITSRDTGRWVIPKGWPMKGKSDAEAARQEAFEEAGARGWACDHCTGLFTYDKVMDDGMLQPVVVSVFPLEVEKMCADYPEKGQRRRKWFAPAKAAARVDEPELKDMLAAFDPSKLNCCNAGNA
ncbi:NUDIX hydrolase [Defluviimonas sp. D31]|uniref:NUDIX hydrolase n=1 Tax=Defluviimonas sp. D31 TaxID=3083253 RepID=UPI00296EC466|nr:NUDIX hydrolase [Defluviimonas sp. D31]MDW4548287.1 NUDIX hydrolase [Defluviimonas sp. D31]